MAYVIIGASGALGRALAGRFAAAGHDLVLVARGREALDALARELGDRHDVAVLPVRADVTEGPAYLDRVIAAAGDHGGVEGLLLPIGASVRDTLEADPAVLRRLAEVNFLAAADAVGRLWDPLQEARRPVIVGFGSITAVRGRRRNLVYSATKRALAAYFESLRLLAENTPVRVHFYVLGFLDTESLAGERTPLPKGDPAVLARRVHANLGRGSGVCHFPRYWRALALLLRLMPWALYRRLAG